MLYKLKPFRNISQKGFFVRIKEVIYCNIFNMVYMIKCTCQKAYEVELQSNNDLKIRDL